MRSSFRPRCAPLLGLATMSTLGLAAHSAQAQIVVKDYTTTGAYNFTVPQGITSLFVQLDGAGGGSGFNGFGGSGAYLAGDLGVSGGEVLTVLVGGGGGVFLGAPGSSGGGGGYGGGAGGGRSIGDGGNGFNGGGGGGRSAVESPQGNDLVDAAGGGGGGSTAGDAGSAGGSQVGGGGSKSNGSAGAASAGSGYLFGGGGGGGGYFGGAGGSPVGGDGGTSLFTNLTGPLTRTDGGAQNGGTVNVGNGGSGEVRLTYSTLAPVPEASTTVSLGLLLALGSGGMLIAAKRKKAAAS